MYRHRYIDRDPKKEVIHSLKLGSHVKMSYLAGLLAPTTHATPRDGPEKVHVQIRNQALIRH